MFEIRSQPTLSWLLEGDPAIRWQVLCDLLDSPAAEWQAERERTLSEGWGARLLSLQDPDGRWGGGIYSPKWTSTTYTLLNLISIGIPPEHAGARRGAQLVIGELLGGMRDERFDQKLAQLDRCIVGMVLRIAVYFGISGERVEAVVNNLLDERMPDGGWNCRRHNRPRPHHSSFHTTFNVLEGLRLYLESGAAYRSAEVQAAETGALELLLEHRLFRSDKTREIIQPKFTLLSYPHYWHYDVLRGLAYFARACGRAIRACKTLSTCCGSGRTGMAPGRRRINTAGRFSLIWRKPAVPAVGTPCALCACCAGGKVKMAHD